MRYIHQKHRAQQNVPTQLSANAIASKFIPMVDNLRFPPNTNAVRSFAKSLMNNLAGERLSIKSESGFQAAKAKYIPSQLPLLLHVLNAFQITFLSRYYSHFPL